MYKSMALGAVLLGSFAAQGATIQFVGPTPNDGTGFGTVLTVLAVQGNGTESGGVAWNGVGDVLAGDAKPVSQTRSVSEFAAVGGTSSNLGVVFNIAQPGANPAVTLNRFDLVFYSASGAELFSATYDIPLVLAQINPGVGGAGYLFNISLSDSERAFFNTGGNRIGLRVPSDGIGNSQGAPESFYLVPAPAPLLLAGAVMLPIRRRRR